MIAAFCVGLGVGAVLALGLVRLARIAKESERRWLGDNLGATPR